MDETAAYPGLTEALDRFQEHRRRCLQCGDWKRVVGRPSLLCVEGKSLWSAVERIERQDAS